MPGDGQIGQFLGPASVAGAALQQQRRFSGKGRERALSSVGPQSPGPGRIGGSGRCANAQRDLLPRRHAIAWTPMSEPPMKAPRLPENCRSGVTDDFTAPATTHCAPEAAGEGPMGPRSNTARTGRRLESSWGVRSVNNVPVIVVVVGSCHRHWPVRRPAAGDRSVQVRRVVCVLRRRDDAGVEGADRQRHPDNTSQPGKMEGTDPEPVDPDRLNEHTTHGVA